MKRRLHATIVRPFQMVTYARHCSSIYRESYNFVWYYIYAIKDYTQSLQISQGQHCLLPSATSITPSPCVIFSCFMTKLPSLPFHYSTSKLFWFRSSCNTWQYADNKWLTVFLRTFRRRRPPTLRTFDREGDPQQPLHRESAPYTWNKEMDISVCVLYLMFLESI